jgi:uncharacterized membrane protein (UPF0136 family)
MMPQLAMAVGVLLVITGLAGYFVSATASLTALIPAVLGALFVLAAGIARRESARKHAMHAAAVLALLGFLGSVQGFGGLVALLGGAVVDRPVAAVTQSITALLCLVFLIFAVRSFVAARRARA